MTTPRTHRLSIPRQLLTGALYWVPALAMLVVAAVGAAKAFAIIGAVRASERDERGETAARVVSGPIRSAPRLSPVLLEPAMVAARVGHTEGSGKNRRFVVDCFITSVDGTVVEDHRTHDLFTLADWEGRTNDLRSGLPVEPRRATVDLRERLGTSSEVPPLMVDWCQGRASRTYADYEEHASKVGETVTVRGCVSPDKPGELRPCLDGGDIVTAQTLSVVRSATKNEQIHWVGIGEAALFVGLLLFGLLARHRRVLSRPDGQPDPWPTMGQR